MHVNISPPLAPVRPRHPLLGEDGGGRKAERTGAEESRRTGEEEKREKTGAEKKKIVHYLSTCCPLLVYMAVHIVVHIHNHEKNSPLLDRLYTPLLLLCPSLAPVLPCWERTGAEESRRTGAKKSGEDGDGRWEKSFSQLRTKNCQKQKSAEIGL